jgi:hypothetical protein
VTTRGNPSARSVLLAVSPQENPANLREKSRLRTFFSSFIPWLQNTASDAERAGRARLERETQETSRVAEEANHQRLDNTKSLFALLDDVAAEVRPSLRRVKFMVLARKHPELKAAIDELMSVYGQLEAKHGTTVSFDVLDNEEALTENRSAQRGAPMALEASSATMPTASTAKDLPATKSRKESFL